MVKHYLFFLLSFLVVGAAGAQINVAAINTAYSENFTAMGSSAAATIPSGFRIGTDWATGTSTTTLAAGTTGLGIITSTSSGGVYNWANGVTASSTDRALGFLSSGSFLSPRSIILKIDNNSGSQITSLNISFDYEKYRSGIRAFDWTFFHGTTSTAATAETLGNQSYAADANTSTIFNPPLSVSKSFTLSGLSIATGTSYYLRWTYTGVAGSTNAQGLAIDNFSITASGTPVAPCPEPSAQATNLILNATPQTVSGSFTPVPAPTAIENYLIIRTTSATLTANPVDGVSYSTGQTVNAGNGTSLGTTLDGSFTDNVSPSTTYYYFIFSMEDQSCGGGPNYLQTSPLTGNITTPALPACVTPTAPPTSLTLTSNNTSVTGTFTSSATANRYLVVISQNATLSASPVNGTQYSNGSAFGGGTVVSFGSTTNFTATGLTPATNYTSFIFAANAECAGAPFYNNTPLTGNITTTNVVLGIPAGYYNDAAGRTCQDLKTSLKTIITTNSQVLSYTPGLWNLYQYSDLRRNDGNTATIIWDMYSDNPTGPEPYTFTYGVNQCGSGGNNVEGDCYNREHSTPQSWFAQASPMVSDAHHIFPTDKFVNATRSNFPYGEVTAPTITSLNGGKLGTGNNFGYTSTVFEPINAYKGDFARAGLYMAVRYEDEIIAQNWSALGTANQVFLSATDQPNAALRRLQIYDTWQLNLLVKWHNLDAVSQKEIDRNNAIYYQEVNTVGTGTPLAQRNRNPFVDRPEYVAAIFQCTGVLPVTLLDFTGRKFDNTVILQWDATFETSFKHYEVERSTDGNNFNQIGIVEGRNLSRYNFTDGKLPASYAVYYRLKMVDIDGKFKYSKVVTLRIENTITDASVYPNPSAALVQIKFAHGLLKTSVLKITDITGRLVKQQTINANTILYSLPVNDLPAGRYFINVDNSMQHINQSFLIIR